jgi:hypothetical protein
MGSTVESCGYDVDSGYLKSGGRKQWSWSWLEVGGGLRETARLRDCETAITARLRRLRRLRTLRRLRWTGATTRLDAGSQTGGQGCVAKTPVSALHTQGNETARAKKSMDRLSNRDTGIDSHDSSTHLTYLKVPSQQREQEMGSFIQRTIYPT